MQLANAGTDCHRTSRVFRQETQLSIPEAVRVTLTASKKGWLLVIAAEEFNINILSQKGPVTMRLPKDLKMMLQDWLGIGDIDLASVWALFCAFAASCVQVGHSCMYLIAGLSHDDTFIERNPDNSKTV